MTTTTTTTKDLTDRQAFPAREQSRIIAWQALLAVAAANKRQTAETAVSEPPTAAVDGDMLRWQRDAGWCCVEGLDPSTRDFLELYLPFCQRPAEGGTEVVGHLGQSLDGCIATHTGDSCFVTGQENIRHLHRMRALADAVIVGAGTVASDDPRLTTRLVPGPNAVRVVLDTRRRLSADRRVFTDGAAPTLLCCAEGLAREPQGHCEVLELPAPGGRLDLPALVQALRRRGLQRLFVEGGGVTVSRFLAQGLLQRLQIAVAPLVIGHGRPGVTLPPRPALSDALRPFARVYRMGQDMLYDFDLRADCGGAEPTPSGQQGIERIC
jgi:riboflavin-specific deaminase-like protein